MKKIYSLFIAALITMCTYANEPLTTKHSNSETCNVSSNETMMPIAAFFLNPALGCAVPHNVFFVDQSTNADEWLWDFGDGNMSMDQNPSHMYTSIGVFTVTLTVTDSTTGASDSTSQTVTVSATNTDFTGSPVIGCGPLMVDFTDTSTASGATITSWLWDFGDGNMSMDQNPSHLYDLPGIYNVTLTVTTDTDCMSSLTRNNYVQVLGPTPEFSTPDPTAGNAPLTVNFVDDSTFGAPAQSWLWDFGNGDTSILQNPTYTYASGCGSFDVTLTVTDINDCSRTIIKEDFIQLTDNALAIDCPTMQTVDATPDCEFIVPDYSDLTMVTGNCIPGMFSQDPPQGTTIGIGTTIITVTVTDGVNTESCTFDLNVEDATAPNVNCPGDQIETFDANCQFTLPDYTSLVTVTDSCEMGLTATQDPPAGTIISGLTTVTFSSTDSAGNTGFCSVNVIPNDTTPPSVICPPNQSEEADANCIFIIPDYTVQAIASDNCGIPILTQSPLPGTEVTVGTTPIIIEASDGLNISECSFDLVVTSSLQLTITGCPDDQTENATSSCEFIVPDYRDQITVNESCGTATLSQTPLPGSTINAGIHTVIITAQDNTNTSECSFVLTVTDIDPPVIICPQDQNETASDNCMFTIPDYTSLAVITDTCGIQSTSQSPTPGSMVGLGTTTITIFATDGFNEVSCSFDIFVEDTEAPVINNCPNDFSVAGSNSSCSFLLPNYLVSAEITDNCISNPTTTQIPSPGTQLNIGENTITITASDGMNESICSFVITVIDQTPPQISCPEDETVEVTDNCTYILPDYTLTAEAQDNCSEVTITQQPPAGTQVPVGITDVVLTANDGVNISECSVRVTVIDTLLPTVQCQNITVELDEDGFVTVDPTILDGGSSDACGIASYEADITEFDCNHVGENMVTLTVTDNNGNSASCTAIVTVNSNANPMAVCENVTAVLDENGMATISPEDVENGSTGGCVFSLDRDTFSCEDIGDPIMVTLTLGNQDDSATSTCTALVNVVDNIDPTISCPTETIIVASLDPFEVPDYVAEGLIEIQDNCAALATYTQVPEAGSLVGAGNTIITVTAIDPSGNTASCSFTIFVDPSLGITNPELTSLYIAPNPANESVTLFNPEHIEIDTITIYDITGRNITTLQTLNDQNTTIDISELSSATYFLKITSKNATQIIQVLKK